MNSPRQGFDWRALVVGAGAGAGLLALFFCGIPFLPPASNLAVFMGSVGVILAITGAVVGLTQGRMALVLAAVVVLGMNGFAIYIGRLGKHLIDYLEGH